MKFSCVHCNKKYGISDEKLKKYKSVFKMRCQDCKNVISINNPFYQRENQEKWYLHINKQQKGPFTFEELKKFSNKELNHLTLVWKTGFKEWQKASNIPELLKIISNQSEKKIKSLESLSKLYESSKNQIEKKSLKEELAQKRLNAIKRKEDLLKAKKGTIKQEEINNLEKQKLERERIILQKEKEEAERLIKEARLAKEKAQEEARLAKEKAQEEARLAKEKAQEEARLAKETAKTAKEEVQKAKEEIEKIKKENNLEKESLSADEFFNSDFEQDNKKSKKNNLLKTVGNNHVMGNTGIFIMYKQNRMKERLGFIVIIVILLLIGGITFFILNKKPKTITKIETKTEYKTKIVKVKEKEYIQVEANNSKSKKKTLKKEPLKNEVEIKEVKKDVIPQKKENSMYGGRNLGSRTAKIDIKKTDNEALNDLENKPYQNRVASVVKDSKKGLFWCYRKELKNSPEAVAKAYFNLKISSSGRVISVKKDFKPEKYNDSNMSSCMTRKIKNWKFPNNPNGEEIKFKFSIAFKSN